MIFMIFNLIALLVLIYLTYYIDRKAVFEGVNSSSLIIPIMLLCVESGLFLLVMYFRTIWTETFTQQMLKIILCIDGVFLVSFSYSIVSLVLKKTSFLWKLSEYLFFALAVFIVFFQYELVDMSESLSPYITSNYLFSEAAREYFPWNWATLYNIIFKYALPAVGFLSLIVLVEKRDSQLLKYQSLIIGEGIVVMWILDYFFRYVDKSSSGYYSLFIYAYVALYVFTIVALKKKSVPSGRATFITILKNVIALVVPSIAVGLVVMFLQPVNAVFQTGYVIAVSVVAIVGVLFSLKLLDILSGNSRLYTADYGQALERQLATLDYSGEMDTITNRMYEIFRRNVEASSVNVYILNNKNMLETAYSSNGFTTSISVNNPIFDTLLNINKSVVCYSEIGNVHNIAAVDDQLKEFFETTKSDALFILNEGHNILGLITLGKKLSGDHYKEYDMNVFINLYSYFFVFGYYMRNISNKDVISVVNREIRMSSQIITSIQENIDQIKSTKVDSGYLMVPAHNIGGDFIDMIRLTDTRHLFVIGDMSGKGIAASMNMVILKSIIRTYLAETHDFKELVVKVNSFIRDSLNKGTIFSGLFALIDFETDTMYYINCGIPALMLYTQVYNNVIEIQGSGHILGFVKDISPYISVKTTKLNRGDIILACTDGLVTSHSLRGEQFGKERIQQCMLDNSTYPAQRMVQFTFDNLLKFMSKEMEDDVSLLVLKYETAAEFNTEEAIEAEAVEGGEEFTATADEVVEPEVPAEETPEQPVETEPEAAVPAEESTEMPMVSEEAPVVEPEQDMPSGGFGEMPDDPDIPDLSNLDEMLKMAGL